jgi:hypothetical protein
VRIQNILITILINLVINRFLILNQTNMKQISKFFTLAIVMIAFSASTFAQVSATATASATIVSPIAIANASNMNFGNIAVSASLGTVVLPAAAGVPVRTVTGGCTLPAVAGTVSAASFTVTGEAAFTYAITLPASASLTGPGPAMTANTFVSSPTVAAGGVLTGGTQTLYVGATLNVAGSQTAGAYTTAAPFTVTVNYN